MSALSAVLFIFVFQFSVLYCSILITTRQAAPTLRHTIGFNTQYIGHQTLPRIWVGTSIMRNVQPSGKTLNWF